MAAGGDQYRIVYFTDDGLTVESLSVLRRPPQFDGLDGGLAVVVNGPSGAGKSSLLRAIADASDLPRVLFDEPVMGVVDQPYLVWRDRAPQLHRGFLDAMAALARRGNVVALAAAGHPAGVVDEAFHDVRMLRVGLDCDTATLLERERGREGRWGGLVEASLPVHDGWHYDLRFDTARRPATEIAVDVLAWLSSTPSCAGRRSSGQTGRGGRPSCRPRRDAAAAASDVRRVPGDQRGAGVGGCALAGREGHRRPRLRR